MKKHLWTLLPLLALTGCSFTIHFPTFSSGGSIPSATVYSIDGNVGRLDHSASPHMREVGATVGMDYLPNTGNVRVLVLPIQFSGYPFNSSYRTDLDNVLNGNGADDTGYWESLASFYEKSSGGSVHLSFDIADIYSVSDTPRSAVQNHGDDNGIYYINNALENYKRGHSAKSYDSDNNGWVDGVIAVYSCPDFQSGGFSFDRNQLFWAYTFWALDNPNRSSPTLNLYFWLSIDFIYEAVKSPHVDSHTLDHETGHMFGLDDYYPSSGSFDPVGGFDMMSHNILDHDAFSKTILGWNEPYIVTGDAEITLNPSCINGECIIIPTASYNGTVFDEYMLVEFYTPEGLNYLDSHQAYPDRVLGFRTPGVKIFHVDARVMRYQVTSSGAFTSIGYVTNPAAELASPSGAYGYCVGATNCAKDYVPGDSSFSLIHLMEAGGRNTFKKGSYGSETTLFKQGQSFSLASFGADFFPKKTTMNNGEAFPYTITVKQIDGSTSATISITRP